MKLAENQIIRYLGTIDPTLMQFFSPVERAIIDVCRKVIEESGENQNGK